MSDGKSDLFRYRRGSYGKGTSSTGGEIVTMEPVGGAVKHDQGKPDVSLVPKELVFETAKALMVGERKYGRHNFTSGFKSSRLISAAMRHLFKYADGENFDQEDGQHHLGAAAACIGMLLKLEALNRLDDDRYKPQGGQND